VEGKEGLVGISPASGTFFLSVVVYLLISRCYIPSWLGFVSSAFDVTLISSALALFLLVNQPHTVNSKVVFEGYFLAIGSTSRATTNGFVLRRACWRLPSTSRLFILRQVIGT
jgi:hypothetical protein